MGQGDGGVRDPGSPKGQPLIGIGPLETVVYKPVLILIFSSTWPDWFSQQPHCSLRRIQVPSYLLSCPADLQFCRTAEAREVSWVCAAVGPRAGWCLPAELISAGMDIDHGPASESVTRLVSAPEVYFRHDAENHSLMLSMCDWEFKILPWCYKVSWGSQQGIRGHMEKNCEDTNK